MIKDEDESIYDYYEEEYSCSETNQNNEPQIGLTKSSSYCIIKHEEISKLRDSLIKIVEEFTNLPRDYAILFLLYFNWNIDKLQDQ